MSTRSAESVQKSRNTASTLRQKRETSGVLSVQDDASLAIANNAVASESSKASALHRNRNDLLASNLQTAIDSGAPESNIRDLTNDLYAKLKQEYQSVSNDVVCRAWLMNR